MHWKTMPHRNIQNLIYRNATKSLKRRRPQLLDQDKLPQVPYEYLTTIIRSLAISARHFVERELRPINVQHWDVRLPVHNLCRRFLFTTHRFLEIKRQICDASIL
jgi:hypothetical protein